MNQGEPANDHDVWFRVFTNATHIQNGRVHHSAFTGGAISDRENSPNDSELSGRLLSRAGPLESITQFGTARAAQLRAGFTAKGKTAPSYLVFRGIGAASIRDLRNWPEIPAEVLYEREDYDIAHANLIFKGKTKAQFDDDAKRALSLKLAAIEMPHLSPVFGLGVLRNIVSAFKSKNAQG